MDEYDELTAKYDKAQSFYRKAYVKQIEGGCELYSYETLVCTIDKEQNKFFLNDDIDEELLLSNTTLRHIKEFLKQYYYHENKDITKKDLKKMLGE